MSTDYEEKMKCQFNIRLWKEEVKLLHNADGALSAAMVSYPLVSDKFSRENPE
ncbi:MAG: hypothetical protein ACYSWZ_00900 [Planctomycetota bacterium]